MRALSVQDIGFGDSGKGLFVDTLVRRFNAKVVVRFNGGAQAGHNVVERLDGGRIRHHTFSQLGSGTFVPDVATVLLHPFVLHPTALLVEVDVLQDKGVTDPFARLHIDARCRVTTPYHQAAGRLRERLRSAQAHGTCGVGFGETVSHSLSHPDDVLCYGDLFSMNDASVLERLERIRCTLCADIFAMMRSTNDSAWALQDQEWMLLCDQGISHQWLMQIQPLKQRCEACAPGALREYVGRFSMVVFEGAQGVLLDEWRGFHPHTTWSTIHTDVVDIAAAFLGMNVEVLHIGVMRSYLTRHGCGPLPSFCASLNHLKEPHNLSDGWQGAFRRGQPDSLLLRYGVKAIGNLSALAVSHLDVFERHGPLRWVQGYQHLDTGVLLSSIPFCETRDLERQAQLASTLARVVPSHALAPTPDAETFLAQVQALSQLPVWMHSSGPSAADVWVSPTFPNF